MKAFTFGGGGRRVEHFVDGTRGARHVLGCVDAGEVESGVVLKPADRLFQVFSMEVESAGRRVNGVDAAQGEVKVGGKDRTLQVNVVADLPVKLVRQLNVHDATGAILLPGR
jgi:hypothetical protein